MKTVLIGVLIDEPGSAAAANEKSRIKTI